MQIDINNSFTDEYSLSVKSRNHCVEIVSKRDGCKKCTNKNV